MGDSSCMRRLAKELQQLMGEPPAGVKVEVGGGEEAGASDDMRTWTVNVDGAPGTLYEGEHFRLQFRFSESYPFSSPEVMFVGDHIPIHPHIYSNGHICLSILADDWTPALSVQSVCLSILSMLSSCKEKKRPPDNALYVRTCSKNPTKTRWWFHARDTLRMMQQKQLGELDTTVNDFKDFLVEAKKTFRQSLKVDTVVRLPIPAYRPDLEGPEGEEPTKKEEETRKPEIETAMGGLSVGAERRTVHSSRPRPEQLTHMRQKRRSDAAVWSSFLGHDVKMES